MKKINRLVSNDDFSLVIKSGKQVSNNSFKVCYKTNSVGMTRFGIAASKKLGNAVIRSTTRRRVRALCDLLWDYSKSIDIVVIPRSNFLQESFENNKNDLKSLFEKIN